MADRIKPTRRRGRRRAVDPGALLHQALQHHQAGRVRQAASIYKKVLTHRPGNPDALHLLGVLAHQRGDHARAVDLIERAVAVNTDQPMYHNNLGLAVAASGRPEEAIVHFRMAAAIAPHNPETHCNLANAFDVLQRHEEAVEANRTALSLAPDNIMALTNLGFSLCKLERHEDGVSVWRKGLAIAPNEPDLHRNLGIALQELGRYEEALSSCRKALSVAPEIAESHLNVGNALQHLNRHEEAVGCFEKALSLAPDDDVALNNLGNSLVKLNRFRQAVACFEKVIAAAPENADYHNNLGNAFHRLNRQQEALESFQKALALDPLHSNALSQAVHIKREMCLWDGIEDIENNVIDLVRENRTPVNPFSFMNVADDPALQLSCAVTYRNKKGNVPPSSAPSPARAGERKLRIGYIAETFRLHPVSSLIAQLVELHDRSKFEICAFSHGRDDGSPMRRRLEAGFDEFHDVRRDGDDDIAQRIKSSGIDILVDLDGYTEGNRLQLMASRPAQIQAHFLGFPGTLGAEFIDYLFVDDIVVPAGHAQYYAENLVYLPNTFQVNDRKRRIAANTPTRAECGLPTDGFVFCCFNNSYKITHAMFDIWMRLLRDLPESVLWLAGSKDSVEQNLRDEADRRSVDPARLVFAPRREDLADHLARHRLADLFLDTLPYNAHTTASDAVWAGLPVLTCAGRSFTSRVAASVLHAIDLPELVTEKLADYESLARRLATEPDLLRAIGVKLNANRETEPLFDTDRFRRHFEAAFERMWAINQSGEPPRSFHVSPIRKHAAGR